MSLKSNHLNDLYFWGITFFSLAARFESPICQDNIPCMDGGFQSWSIRLLATGEIWRIFFFFFYFPWYPLRYVNYLNLPKWRWRTRCPHHSPHPNHIMQRGELHGGANKTALPRKQGTTQSVYYCPVAESRASDTHKCLVFYEKWQCQERRDKPCAEIWDLYSL